MIIINKNTNIKVELRSHEYEDTLKECLRSQLISLFYYFVDTKKYSEIKVSLSSKSLESELSESGRLLIRCNWEYFTDSKSPFFENAFKQILNIIDDNSKYNKSDFDNIIGFENIPKIYDIISLPVDCTEKDLIKLLDIYESSKLTILNKNKDYMFVYENIESYFVNTKKGYINTKVCIH